MQKRWGAKIKSIKAREILDSRGKPTIEVDLSTEKGLFRAAVPSGASKGKYEAMAINPKLAVKNVNEIIGPKLKGKDAREQKEIDELMIKLDGTENKSRLGANAMVGVSMACCRAGAGAQNMPLWSYISKIAKTEPAIPLPSFNIINGGAHAGNELDFQEFMIVPEIKPYAKGLRAAAEIYHALKQVLKNKFGRSAVNIGDEGGFAPPISLPEQALNFIQEAVKKAGYGDEIKNILDVAASQFYLGGKYQLRKKKTTFTREGFLNYYQALIKKYPIVAIEDPFAEEDWQGFQAMTKKFGKKIIIIGDDLLVTNPKKIKEARSKKACNGLLLKVNQIGTVSEAIGAGKLAQSFGWKVVVSHRSGETRDDFIADLSVGLGADYIKAGAPARSERLAKYNRLLRIEEELK